MSILEKACESVTQSCPIFATPRKIGHEAALSMGFTRQEYWSGSPFPPPGDLPQGLNPGLLHCSWVLYCLPTRDGHMTCNKLNIVMHVLKKKNWLLLCVQKIQCPCTRTLTKHHLHKLRLQLYSQLIFAFHSLGSFLFQWEGKPHMRA